MYVCMYVCMYIDIYITRHTKAERLSAAPALADLDKMAFKDKYKRRQVQGEPLLV